MCSWASISCGGGGASCRKKKSVPKLFRQVRLYYAKGRPGPNAITFTSASSIVLGDFIGAPDFGHCEGTPWMGGRMVDSSRNKTNLRPERKGDRKIVLSPRSRRNFEGYLERNAALFRAECLPGDRDFVSEGPLMMREAKSRIQSQIFSHIFLSRFPLSWRMLGLSVRFSCAC